jgi:RHS repeat-associated protein
MQSFYGLSTRKHFFFLLWSLTWLLSTHELKAQSVLIQKGYGNPCAGENMIFYINNDCSASWSVSGSDYTIVSESSSSITVRWNSAQSNVGVYAYYSNCSSPRGEFGHAYSPAYTISGKVDPFVSVSANITTLCVGASVTFTAAPTNGGSPTYTWSVNNGTKVSTGTSNTFSTSNFSTGSNTITCEMSSSVECKTASTATASVNVTVNPYPTATISPSGPVSFCSSGTLTAAAGTGYAYQWLLNGSAITGATGSTYTVTQSGSYSVRATANACSSTSSTVDVTVNQLPTASITPAGPLTINVGSSATLSATTGTGYSYQWQLNGSAISGATSATYNASQSGSYSVVVTANGCVSTSNSVSVTSSCLTPPVILTPEQGVGANLSTKLTANTRSLTFDGVDDYVQVGSTSELAFNNTSSFSIEAWFKTSSTAAQAIISKMSNSAPYRGYDISMNGGGLCVHLINTWSTNAFKETTTSTYNDGRWHHVVWTYNGNGNVSGSIIYVDGVVQSTVTDANVLNATTIDSNTPVRIGARTNGVYFNGQIDEVRIWNKVRNQAEIQANLNLSPPANDPNLVAYWRLDEGSGTTVADATGKGNTGTLTNGPAWSSTATSYTWSPATGLNTTTGAVVMATPLATTNYTATATFANGCTNYAVVSVSGNDYNYVITNAVQQTGITTDAQLQALTIHKDQLSQSISYMDGLGRTVQTVVTQGSPTKKDVIQPVVYDAAGRETKKYLSYTGGDDGRYKAGAPTAQATFYQNLKGDNTAFSESRFEDAPLNRVLEQSTPGANWKLAATPAEGKTQKVAYYANGSNEIRHWNFNGTDKTATGTSFYPANSLSVTQSTDEHGVRSWEYKDKGGQTVAKRVQKLNRGLVAAYSFSGHANDASFNGNHGTINGATLTTDRFGTANSAYQFSGSSYIKLPAANFQLSNFTYSFWAKPSSNPAAGGLYGVLSVGSTGGDQLSSLMNAYDGTAANTGWSGGGNNASGGGSTTALSGTLPTVGTWYHMTVTRDDANVKVYVNGVLAKTVSTGNTKPSYGTGTVAAIIGARFNLTQFFQGALDDVRIYNRALAAAEITELYNNSANASLTSDLMTYYVYDDFANLRFMIPPEGVNNLAGVSYTFAYNDAFCKKWVFASDYDDRFRVVENLKPGASPTWVIYDPADRAILEQDAAHRPLNQWLFTKYDALGREIMSGRYTYTAASRAAMQTVVDEYYVNNPSRTYYETRSSTDFANLHGYSNQAFPQMPSPNSASGQPYIVNYYDDYDFDSNGTAAETAKGEPAFVPVTGYATTVASTKGKSTGKRVLVLGTSTWLTSAVYYDPQGRAIQTQDENYNNAAIVSNKGRNLEVTATLYEGLTDRVKQTERKHCYALSDNSSVLTIRQVFEYDASSRLKSSKMAVGNPPPATEELLATYAYNEAGEMIQKKLGTGNLQTIDYQYNIRGWLKSINGGDLTKDNDLFAMRFRHEETEATQPQYNGNVSRIDWISKTDNVARTYQYGYDGLNRFLSADYSSGVAAEKFSVSTTYQDDNGNIKTLNRQNLVARNGNAVDTYDFVDKLNYAYDGNQLKSVEDDITLSTAVATDLKEKSRTTTNANGIAVNPTEYTYDPSGKLLSDKNKGTDVNLTYNDLDLPATIQMASNKNIANVYAATGDKLQMTVTDGATYTYKYIGGIVYLNDVPQFIPTPEGRVISPQAVNIPGNNAWIYEYFYRDQLGDLRVAFRSGGNTRSFTATLDPVSDVAWSNVTAPIRNSEQAFNAGGFSAKLVPANPLGPWKTVKVGKGDVITVSALAKYISTTTPNNSAVNLITYVNGLGAQSTESENNKTWLSLGLQITPVPPDKAHNSSVPKAYLEYLLQTEGDNAVTKSKQVFITIAALNGWEPLTMSYTAETDGYLQVLVANDSDQPVWFDNVSISVQPALITQETHYDPWGLELAGIERRGSPEHRWKFQGKESITDLSLYWQDFGARYYDPQLGRWHVTDPADQFGSPYLGMGNNPVILIDPDGKIAFLPLLAIAVIGGGINVATNWSQIGSFSQGLNFFGVGAVATAVGVVTGGAGGPFAAGAILGLGNAGASGQGLQAMLTNAFTTGVTSAVTAGLFQLGGQAVGNLMARRAAAKALEQTKQLTAGLKELTPKGVTPVEKKVANLASREMQEVAVENAAGAGVSQAARDPLNAAGQKLTHFELNSAAKGGVTVASSAGGKTLPMTTERILDQGSKITDIVNDVKGMTWMTGNEHAVVRLANGQKAIVSGGPGGISFQPNQIRTLFGHTHPLPAPPSAGDYNFLRIYPFYFDRIGQSRQYVISGGQILLIRP